ncbi:phytosulfokines 3-like [Olea europaea var. sylvestris]|uniref:phytosulfokines 3-like n=1 Tax=Olea europaea var. sylvestris TaxID=158386 RepID=UPI000C1D719E|nr:phytosulfokines 3-like [Olea europaea var. sylvestris]
MSKITIVFVIALLFFFTLSSDARPDPAVKIQYEVGKTQTQHVDVEESCKGVGEEECLMRRTLAAHLDYIYTQNHKP